MQQELSELLDIRDRISAREEELENLLLEKEDLMNRLSIAEHQLATQAEQGRVEGQVGEKEQRLVAQLESQGELCETLRARSVHSCVEYMYPSMYKVLLYAYMQLITKYFIARYHFESA